MLFSYFFGACTPRGFYPYAQELLRTQGRVFLIKGGAGCGKSTFLRRLSREAQSRGLDAEEILCSSDPDSLDGLVLPQLGAAFADATAPHVLEPTLCGGRMNYVNFGAFYDADAMRRAEEEIEQVRRQNAACYPRVTACLAAAEALMHECREFAQEEALRAELAQISQCLSRSVLAPVGQKGTLRRVFLAALTPKGRVLCEKTPPALCARVYVLRDEYGLAPQVLQPLCERAVALGHSCIAGFSPLQFEGAPSYLLLPQANTAFVSDSSLFPYTGPCFCRIDLDSTLPPQQRKRLAFCRETTAALLEHALGHLQEAKRLHDRIEQLCRPFVDFAAVDALTERFVRELFGA